MLGGPTRGAQGRVSAAGGAKDTRSLGLVLVTIPGHHLSDLSLWRWELPSAGGAEGQEEAKWPWDQGGETSRYPASFPSQCPQSDGKSSCTRGIRVSCLGAGWLHSNIDVLGLQVLILGVPVQQERQGPILGGHCMLMRDIQLLPLGFSGESLIHPTGGCGWMGDPCVRLPHRMTGKVCISETDE